MDLRSVNLRSVNLRSDARYQLGRDDRTAYKTGDCSREPKLYLCKIIRKLQGFFPRNITEHYNVAEQCNNAEHCNKSFFESHAASAAASAISSIVTMP